MSPDVPPHRVALRLALATTLALVWGTMAGEPLPGLTAVLTAQILVGMPRPPRLGQAAALVGVILATGGVAFAVASTFSDRPLILAAALGLLFYLGFSMRERAASEPSLPATMLLNFTAVVPVLTFQAEMLGAGVLETLVTSAVRAMLVVWLLHAALPVRSEETAIRAATPAKAEPVPDNTGTAHTLAKVAIVLPAQFYYLAEPTALAFPALLGLVTFLSAQDPAAGRMQLVILLLGNLIGSVAAALASGVLDIGPQLPALTFMTLLGSLAFAKWIMSARRRPGGAVALTGLVTFLTLFGLAAAPHAFEVPVLDRIMDIAILSLYTVAATTLLLPPHGSPEPTTSKRRLAGHAGRQAPDLEQLSPAGAGTAGSANHG
ncbi:DUF2955 domain-containing protein [Sediminicoccus sp. KRV36]|uniref:DUF2955 domain-containing protein n=1 Tax=Sediminicoccus sp. KRV36 TaxID=3133721 RepID=UPI00200CBEF1|nr:DUF2955 domain-containing protein [Sediminicoccus rosea]UPY38294.1 DUF2955 domain-containing protein [Sediminicoccus rosea]